jgi:large subunit ribosomal protein L21
VFQADKKTVQILYQRLTDNLTIREILDMYAVIKTGGKQYKVAANDVIKIEMLDGVAGQIITLDTVLMLGGEQVVVGAPLVAGASVSAIIVEQTRGPKTISFKKRRRQNSKRKKGHRQHLTIVKIEEILTGGAKTALVSSINAGKYADDVSIIGGVGPALKNKLAAYGVTSLTQIADMSAEEIAQVDADLKLGGRTVREEWVEQAKELVAGKPPRAKIDQKAVKSK